MDTGASSPAGDVGAGGCACGSVRFRCTGELRPVIDCHCQRCRRITGHYMAATGCSTHDLEVDDGGSLRWYEAAAGVFYGFCGTCGSTLFWRADGLPEWMSIAAGTLDLPTHLSTSEAWWVSTASDYHHRSAGLIEYAQEPPAR